MPAPRIRPGLFTALALFVGLGFVNVSLLVADAPVESTMGVVQKIFYFHVPCAWLLMLSTFVAAGGSAAFLFKGSERGDRLALCAAELGVLFGLCVMTTGPLWARAAWGVYWTWDARLTTSLLLLLSLVAYTLARRYGGPGARKLAAALALFAAADVPLVYFSVSLWRTLHPRAEAVSSLAPGMKLPFFMALALFTAAWGVLLTLRLLIETARQTTAEIAARLEEEEEENAR